VYSSCVWACEVALDIMKVAGAETIDTNDLEGHEGSRLHRAGGRSAQHESDRIWCSLQEGSAKLSSGRPAAFTPRGRDVSSCHRKAARISRSPR
jgi:hypothetical protein